MGCEALATKAEVAALRAEITALKSKSIDVGAIVNQAKDAVFSDGQWLAALAAIGAFKNVDLSQYLTKQDPNLSSIRQQAERAYKATNNLQADLAEAKNVANAAKSQASAASRIASSAQSAVNGLSGTVAGLSSRVGFLGREISSFGGALGTLGALVNSLLSILSVVGGAAGLIALFGTLYAIIPRLDAQEKYLDSISKTSADAYSLASSNQMQLRAYQARNDARVAKLENDFDSLARAVQRADIIIQSLVAAVKRADILISNLNTEIVKVNQNIANLGTELNKTKTDIGSLQAALKQQQANIQQLQKDLNSLSASSDSRFRDLQAQATEISKKANLAIERANKALRKANEAATTTQRSQQSADETRSELKNWVRVWNPTIWEPKITNQITQTRNELRNISIQEASNQVQQRLSSASSQIQQQLATNTQKIRNEFATAATNSTQLRNISADEASKEVQRRLGAPTFEQAIAQSSTIQDLRIRVVTPPTVAPTVEQVIATSPTTRAITKDVSDLKTQLEERKQVDKEALAKLGIMVGTIAALPTTFANNATYNEAMKNNAAAGTCRTTQPGGCSSNLINNAVDNINSNVKDNGKKFDGLKDTLNTTLNGFNAALIEQTWRNTLTINSKLGAQLPGGLAGASTRLSKFLGIDRIFNLLNFLAVLHNASMLSASLKVTLLETLSSVGNATGLLQTSEGDNVDLNSVFNQGIETFITSLIGVDAWASMKLTWRKYSSIYRAGANVLSNVGNMFSSIGNGIEVIGERTGKIGNAIRAAGVVRENAYQWMSENMTVHTNRFMTFQTTVNGVTQVLEAVNEVAQSTVEGQQAYTEAVKATTEFKKLLEEGKKSDTKDAQNKAIAEEAVKIKENLVKDPTGSDDEGLLSFLTDR